MMLAEEKMNLSRWQKIYVRQELPGLRGLFRHCAIWLAAAWFSVAALPAPSQERAPQPLSQPQVIDMLERHTFEWRMESFVKARRIDFCVTAKVEDDLKKNHRASESFISLLKQFQPVPKCPPEVVPPPQRTEP